VPVTYYPTLHSLRPLYNPNSDLLLLWSVLDNKDSKHGLFAIAYTSPTVAATMLLEWIGEIRFGQAMQLLRNNSLVDEAPATRGYATHPVLHQWAYYSRIRYFGTELNRLSIIAVDWGVRGSSTGVLEVDCTEGDGSGSRVDLKCTSSSTLQ
jgi:hypothetical protein